MSSTPARRRQLEADDDHGQAWSSAHPGRGRRAWHAAALDASGFPTGTFPRPETLACASGVCVAGDAGGRVFVGR